MNAMLVIAKATVRGLIRDRIFHAAIVLNFLFLLFSVFLSSLTIIEQRKILLDFGFAAASFVGIGFAIFLGSGLVRHELESRTVYTLLAKPLSRAEYLGGKILGGALVVIGLHLISFATLFLALYLQKEAAPPGFGAVVYLSTLEGLLYLFLSVAISLVCSSLFLGAALTLAIFLVGRSAYAFELMAEKAAGFMHILCKGLYLIFPAGQRFDIREVVAYGRDYPADMLLPSSVYFLAYAAFVSALAVLVFRKRDLP